MAKVQFSILAHQDLTAHIAYIAEHNPGAAAAQSIRILSTITKLRRFPEMGRARDDLVKGLRSFAIGNYIIFYAYEHNVVSVVRILHGAQDIESEFGLNPRVDDAP